MKIHLIWAQDINGGIGKNNKLPWYIPQDLKNFKKITLNKIIIMDFHQSASERFAEQVFKYIIIAIKQIAINKSKVKSVIAVK